MLAPRALFRAAAGLVAGGYRVMRAIVTCGGDLWRSFLPIELRYANPRLNTFIPSDKKTCLGQYALNGRANRNTRVICPVNMSKGEVEAFTIDGTFEILAVIEAIAANR